MLDAHIPWNSWTQQERAIAKHIAPKARCDEIVLLAKSEACLDMRIEKE
jgi:hypothetical protein